MFKYCKLTLEHNICNFLSNFEKSKLDTYFGIN